ncbi:MAG: hypothetical protein ACXVRE_09585 [Gaiellaceae bacterium]
MARMLVLVPVVVPGAVLATVAVAVLLTWAVIVTVTMSPVLVTRRRPFRLVAVTVVGMRGLG